jgi:hypothetical protein
LKKQIILIDVSNIAHAMFHAAFKERTLFYSDFTNAEYFQYLIYNKLKDIKKRFPTGEMILTVDSKSWRKSYFKYYKARRVLQRAKSKVPIDEMYRVTNLTLKDIKEIFPYKVIKVQWAEADDIIGILTSSLRSADDIIIVSRDKDFAQLQKYDNVRQYDPITKDFTVCGDPHYYLISHIIMGDSGDDLTNILSDRNTFVQDKKRQKSCGIKKVNEIMDIGVDKFLEDKPTIKERFKQNKKMIELSENTIPKIIQKNVLNQYYNYKKFKHDSYLDMEKYFRDNKHLNPFVKNVLDFI